MDRACELLQDRTDRLLPRPGAAAAGGYKANHYDVATGDHYWVSGPKRKGEDRLYGERVPVYVDEDVREDYWVRIRGLPDRAADGDASH